MSNSQNRIIGKLLDVAMMSRQNTKVAAAICSGSKILAINSNTHRNKYGDEIKCSGHGEVACIHNLLPFWLSKTGKKGYMIYDSKVRRRMRKMTIYVARYKSSTQNLSGHSAPCSNCLCKIKETGIKKIVYADENGNIQKCLTKNFETDFVSMGYREYSRQNIEVC